MTIEHKASYATGAFNVIALLEAQLEAKRKVLAGQLQEHGRLEHAIGDSTAQIKDIEAAIQKLKA